MSEMSFSRRAFIIATGGLFAASMFGCSTTTAIDSVREIDLKDKYFNNSTISKFGEFVKKSVSNKNTLVDIIYIDEGAIDIGAFINKYGTDKIYIQNESKTADTLTTECTTNFFDSLYDGAVENINRFTVYNNKNYNLRTIINTAAKNYEDNGIPTVIFFTSRLDKDFNETASMKELDEFIGQAKDNGVVLIVPGGKGGESIEDYKYSCCNNAITINSCNYDGKPRGNENKSGDNVHINYAMPSDNSLVSTSVFAACAVQTLMDNSTKASNIVDVLDGYAIEGLNPEETSGSGVLTLRNLS